MELKTYKGIQIEVTERGYFSAKLSEANLTSETLTDLEAKIDKELAFAVKKTSLSLNVCFISRQQYSNDGKCSVVNGTLTGVNRTSGKPQITGLTKDEIADFILPVFADNHELLMEYAKRKEHLFILQKRIEKRHLKIDVWGRTDAENYPTILARIVDRYNAIIEAQKAEAK